MENRSIKINAYVVTKIKIAEPEGFFYLILLFTEIYLISYTHLLLLFFKINHKCTDTFQESGPWTFRCTSSPCVHWAPHIYVSCFSFRLLETRAR